MNSDETLLNEGTSPDNQEQNTQPTQIEVNGQMVDIDELKKGYLRQSDYTKKSQELAREREKLSQNPSDSNSDDELAEKFLQEKGYVKKSDIQAEIDAKLAKERDSYYLEKLMENNPSLKQHEVAIRKIAEVDDSAIDDIIVKYNFLSSDKLNKAKQRDIVWGNNQEEKSIDISNMTSEQWEAHKAKMWIGGSNWLTKSRTF